MENEQLIILEAILFLENNPIKKTLLKQYLKITEKELENLLSTFQNKLLVQESIFELATGEEIFLKLKKNVESLVVDTYKNNQQKKLSQASLEVLSFVAVNKEVTKNELDELRGIDNAYILKNLLKEGFIKIIGVKDAIGKPLIYSTSSKFLQFFGLKNTDELPSFNDIKQIYSKK